MRTAMQDGASSDPDASSDAVIRVGWEDPEDGDPENPQNWSSMAKWANILTISVISFLV
jgi:hypothetical protein